MEALNWPKNGPFPLCAFHPRFSETSRPMDASRFTPPLGVNVETLRGRLKRATHRVGRAVLGLPGATLMEWKRLHYLICARLLESHHRHAIAAGA
jgi:hypothetical protein